MDFFNALRQVRDGHKVARQSWPDKSNHCMLRDGKLMVYLSDNLYHPWTVNDGDLFGEDWYVIPVTPPVTTSRSD